MATKTLKWMLAIGIVAGLLGNRPVYACGPFVERAIFTYSVHPDLPLTGYAQGQLGILQPTYARSYLYVAYRYLRGMGFHPEEQEALVSLWHERLNPRADHWHANANTAMKVWLEARAQVTASGPPPQVTMFKALEARNGLYYYHEYVNCHADAFFTAARTLTERIEQFGAESVGVQEWVRAQDQVFSNCSGARTIPDPAAPQIPEMLQKDRAYQIAAAHFYAGDLAVAERLFRDIANDPTSHWRLLGPYLVARTLLRQGSLVPRHHSIDNAKLTDAQHTLHAILADQNLQVIHPATQRLLGVVRSRLVPVERLQELAQSLLTPDRGTTLKQDLWDYTLLLDRVTGDRAGREAGAVRHNEVTDWILTFQDTSAGAQHHALERWTATSALPWLVASLAKVNAEHPKSHDLLAAAAKVPQAEPAFASVTFHRLRLLTAMGKRDEARQLLDQLLSQEGLFPPSARNLLLALRMKLARTVHEFLIYAPRVPVAITYNIDGRELPEDLEANERLRLIAHDRPLFDADAARIFNQRLPLGLLRELVHHSVLPTHLSREVAMAVLTRSLLLREEDSTRDLVPAVKILIPELGPWLDEYRATISREARAFTGMFMLLRFPGLKPYVTGNVGRLTPLDHVDTYRDNWWCTLDAVTLATSGWRERPSAPLEVLYRAAPDHTLEFLSAAQAREAQRELGQLASLGAAPNYFSQQVMAWTQRSGNDPRVPKALHLAVKSTRFGCTDADTAALSKAVFDLLHQRYPRSPWAQKTKYWYQ